tara:strand:+ start:845 stop:2878 length:2034 start_codon:yes stop_codon:yes gene_type:complete
MMSCVARWLCVAVHIVIFASPLRSEVVQIEVTERAAFAGGQHFGNVGPYERVKGWLTIAVDPAHALNRVVTDIGLAPRDKDGRVRFRTEFFLLKPVDARRSNGRILYDVNNRGNKLALGAFNNPRGGNRNDPKTAADAGNGFLMRHGYSVLWCGWNGDVKPGGGRIMIELPVARQPDGSAITSKIYAEICVLGKSKSQPFSWGNSVANPAVSLDNGTARLTMRPNRQVAAKEVPHDKWSFARVEGEKIVTSPGHLYLEDGFRPGWIYELVYTGRDPLVTGLGFVAARDCISFFKFGRQVEGLRNPLAGAIDKAYIFGISQSGRFIHHFLFEGMNTDEAGRMVLDGALPHVGGAGKGQFNYRFAQTTRHGSPHQDNLYASDFFPFNSVPQVDPVTGQRGDSFRVLRERGHMPKVFFSETSTEYWCRGASLLHTDTVGKTDAEIDPHLRLYLFNGAQHGISSTPSRGMNRNRRNHLDHRPLLRALLVAMDRWVTSGIEPPPTAIPRIDNHTLVDLATWLKQFPDIPDSGRVRSMYRPLRLDPGPRWFTQGIADHVPPKVGKSYRVLVPAVDRDGIELPGIKLPEVSVPLGTYTGWNLVSGEDRLMSRLSGSWLPFAKTKPERERSGDPRLSVRERYPTRSDYLARMTEAVLDLKRRRLLLDEDAVAILEKARSVQAWSD